MTLLDPADRSDVVTAQPDRPGLNSTTAAPEPPVVTVTAQPPVINDTIPPLLEETTSVRKVRSLKLHQGTIKF